MQCRNTQKTLRRTYLAFEYFCTKQGIGLCVGLSKHSRSPEGKKKRKKNNKTSGRLGMREKTYSVVFVENFQQP